MPETCGCLVHQPEISLINGMMSIDRPAYLERCPLHTRAADMRELLKDWVEWYDSPSHGRGCGTLATEARALLEATHA